MAVPAAGRFRAVRRYIVCVMERRAGLQREEVGFSFSLFVCLEVLVLVRFQDMVDIDSCFNSPGGTELIKMINLSSSLKVSECI